MKLIRNELLNQLTATLIGLQSKEPTLVAIDGRSAAGKTTFADELALHIQQRGRPTLRSSIDDFHPPGYKDRRQQRPYTPQTYYAECYDYAKFRAYLLDPLRNGAQHCRLAYWDSFHDVAHPEHWHEILPAVVVIVDGIFLLRSDLRHYWDYTIWLQIDWETMIQRACNRDSAWIGSAEDVEHRYRTFWIPTHQYYEAEDQATTVANLVLDNQNPEAPVVVKGDLLVL